MGVPFFSLGLRLSQFFLLLGLFLLSLSHQYSTLSMLPFLLPFVFSQGWGWGWGSGIGGWGLGGWSRQNPAERRNAIVGIGVSTRLLLYISIFFFVSYAGSTDGGFFYHCPMYSIDLFHYLNGGDWGGGAI